MMMTATIKRHAHRVTRAELDSVWQNRHAAAVILLFSPVKDRGAGACGLHWPSAGSHSPGPGKRVSWGLSAG